MGYRKSEKTITQKGKKRRTPALTKTVRSMIIGNIGTTQQAQSFCAPRFSRRNLDVKNNIGIIANQENTAIDVLMNEIPIETKKTRGATRLRKSINLIS